MAINTEDITKIYDDLESKVSGTVTNLLSDSNIDREQQGEIIAKTMDSLIMASVNGGVTLAKNNADINFINTQKETEIRRQLILDQELLSLKISNGGLYYTYTYYSETDQEVIDGDKDIGDIKSKTLQDGTTKSIAELEKEKVIKDIENIQSKITRSDNESTSKINLNNAQVEDLNAKLSKEYGVKVTDNGDGTFTIENDPSVTGLIDAQINTQIAQKLEFEASTTRSDNESTSKINLNNAQVEDLNAKLSKEYGVKVTDNGDGTFTIENDPSVTGLIDAQINTQIAQKKDLDYLTTNIRPQELDNLKKKERQIKSIISKNIMDVSALQSTININKTNALNDYNIKNANKKLIDAQVKSEAKKQELMDKQKLLTLKQTKGFENNMQMQRAKMTMEGIALLAQVEADGGYSELRGTLTDAQNKMTSW